MGATTTTPALRPAQANVLRALLPDDPGTHPVEWPVLDRASLRTACGLSPKNTMNRVINGDSSGRGGAGLVPLGLIEVLKLDVDGVVEDNYRITRAGIAAYRSTNAGDQ